MAIGDNVSLKHEYDRGQPTFPSSLSSTWATAIDAAGMDDLDNGGTVTNPETHITDSSRHKIVRDVGQGTHLVFALAYDASATVTAGGTIVVFGRRDSTDPWVLLRTKNGGVSLSFSCVSTDATDGTLDMTTPNLTTEAVDCLGCNEFLVGVITAHAVSAGSAALAKLLVKVI